MGIGRRQIAFLAASRLLGARFERTLTLGRQRLWADEGILAAAFKEAGREITPSDAKTITKGHVFADELFRYLGARDIDSIDASHYEGSNLIHDMNGPLPDELCAKYSVVFDAGTLEHIFNFPVALRNCLSAVRVGGHFVGVTPGNNWFGHGFYQFSPELYYRAVSKESGFRVRCMLVRADRRAARWYAVADPADIGRRITVSGTWPSLLYILAERLDAREVLQEHPQQSDYRSAWSEADVSKVLRRNGPVLPTQFKRLWDSFPLQQARDWLSVVSGRDPSLRPVRLSRLCDLPVRMGP